MSPRARRNSDRRGSRGHVSSSGRGRTPTRRLSWRVDRLRGFRLGIAGEGCAVWHRIGRQLRGRRRLGSPPSPRFLQPPLASGIVRKIPPGRSSLGASPAVSQPPAKAPLPAPPCAETQPHLSPERDRTTDRVPGPQQIRVGGGGRRACGARGEGERGRPKPTCAARVCRCRDHRESRGRRSLRRRLAPRGTRSTMRLRHDTGGGKSVEGGGWPPEEQGAAKRPAAQDGSRRRALDMRASHGGRHQA